MSSNDSAKAAALDLGHLDVAALEADVQRRMAERHVPALALAVVAADGIVYANGFGVCSAEGLSLPVAADTLFRIASLTKSMVATVIMRLQGRGVLDIHQPIRTFLPDIRFQNEEYGNQITLWHLLTHSAGLRPAGVSGDDTAPDALDRLIASDLPGWLFLAPPKTLHAYSNLGYALAGYVAAKAAITSFTQLMADELFVPLGMDRSTFDPLMAMTYPLTQAHIVAGDRYRVIRPFIHNSAYMAAGGAFSSVLDLARFVQLHLNTGVHAGTRLVSADLVTAMQQQQVDLRGGGWLTGYGFGLFTGTYKNIPVAWHGGSIGPFWGGRMVLASQHGVGVVVLVSRIAAFRADAQAITGRILDQMLRLPANDVAHVASVFEPLSVPLGIYRNPYDEELRLSQDGEQVVLAIEGQRHILTPIRENVFASADGTHWLGVVAGPTHQHQFVLLDSVPYEREH